MKLNLSDTQFRKAKSGKPFQLKHEQIGHGDLFHLHPSNVKKIEKAYRNGKGVRLELSNEEIGVSGAGFMKSMKKVGKKLGVNRAVNKTADTVKDYAKKKVQQGKRDVNKWALKNLTEKNIERGALTGYNRLNKEMQNKGMDSIHGAVIDNVLGAVPFVPQSAKDVASHYAQRAIDKKLNAEKERLGAGMKRKSKNPYLPTGVMGGKGARLIRGGAIKVFDDHRNILRPNQSGFKGQSRYEAEKSTSRISGRGFKIR